jgi:hypothetical protein
MGKQSGQLYGPAQSLTDFGWLPLERDFHTYVEGKGSMGAASDWRLQTRTGGTCGPRNIEVQPVLEHKYFVSITSLLGALDCTHAT